MPDKSGPDQSALMQRWRLRARLAALKTKALKTNDEKRDLVELLHASISPLAKFTFIAGMGKHAQERQKLRVHARAANLAYGFLRLRPYRMMEEKCHAPPRWDRVADLILQHSKGSDSRVVLQKLQEWKVSNEISISPENYAELERRWKATRPPMPEAAQAT